MTKTLAIIDARAGDGPHDVAMVEAVLAFWQDDPPATRRYRAAEFEGNEKAARQTGAAWVLCDDEGAMAFASIAQSLQEHDVPIMLTRWPEHEPFGAAYQPGMVIAPPDAPRQAMTAVLQAFWSQVEVLDNLRNEVRFHQAHHGGLCDQIGKIDEEMRLAAQLQREFLPSELPSVQGVDFQVFFRPASYVSGDIYDVIRLDEDHVGFFLADAVGHGVSAALLTMYIKRSLRTKEVESQYPHGYRIVPPAEALAMLNGDMANQPTENVRFATACYGVINCRTLEVELARAGHPSPMLLRADGTCQWIDPEGGMLGIFPDEVYQTKCFQLQPGDRLMLYSDGFELAFPQPGEGEAAPQIDVKRFEDEFRAMGQASMGRVGDYLASLLDSQAGSLNQRDDLTVLVLDVLPSAVAQAREAELASLPGD